MSNVIDLTGDDISSDDGSSVNDRPDPKRGKKNPSLQNAPSLLSNSGGAVASVGSREVSYHAAPSAASTGQRKSPEMFSFLGAGVASSGSTANVANSNEAIPLRRKDFAASSVAATGASSRHSNDSGDDSDDVVLDAMIVNIKEEGVPGGVPLLGRMWQLKHIYTAGELGKSKTIMCSNVDCDLVACSRWESTEGGKPWNTCLDCQAADYNGWPDEQELPVNHITKEHRRLIVEKCSNHPNPAMPLVPYVEDNASRHRNLIESAAQECIYQPHLPALTLLMSTAEWKREILYTMREGLLKARKGNSRVDKGALDDDKFRVLRDFTRNSDGILDEPDLEVNAPLVHQFLQITMVEYRVTHVAFQEIVEQQGHCDPGARNATPERNARSCHVLVTLLGSHYFALSTSPKIPTMKDRYREWSGGGCAAVKVKPKDCNDILLIARQDQTPFQAIHNTLLAGIVNCDESKQCIAVHAGAPSDLAGIPLGSTCTPLGLEVTDVGWVSSQELVQFQQDRNREFRKPGGPGTDTSVTMICNFYGTRSESAVAFDNAAARVLQMYDGDLDASPDVRSLRHMRDLISHKKLLESGQLCNLSFKHDDFWSEERIEEHYRLCVEKGGCERGRMDGTKLDEHYRLSVAGGGRERGRMAEGTDKDEFVAKSVAKGGIEAGAMVGTKLKEHVKAIVENGGSVAGRMAGTELEDHRANIAEGYKKANDLMFRLANGKKDQEHKWTVSSQYKGTKCYHTFTNRSYNPIEGKRAFKDFLLKNYVSDELTEDGKLALAEMKKNGEKQVMKNNYAANKKKRAN